MSEKVNKMKISKKKMKEVENFSSFSIYKFPKSFSYCKQDKFQHLISLIVMKQVHTFYVVPSTKLGNSN